jgi:hypothetical protein
MSNVVAPIQVPLINGAKWSFQHIELTIANLKFNGGFKAVKYKRERKRDEARSNSPDPVGLTLGENTYTASIVVFPEWWLNLLRTVQNVLGNGYGDQTFTMNVNYGKSVFQPFQDTILGCHFDSTDVDQQAGTAPLERPIDLRPMKILFDGKDDLANPLLGST